MYKLEAPRFRRRRSRSNGVRRAPQASIDLVLLSIGGNDVGFGALALYASIENARDLAPIAALAGGELRYGPDVARSYLGQIDKRIKAVRDALVEGFGVEPSRVLQNAYEPIQFDEVGGYCGSQATLGMDVHPALKVNKARLNEAADVAAELQKRLECLASTRNRRDCPANLATGTGTGFRFITEHVADSSKRGICARDPTRRCWTRLRGKCRAAQRRPTNGSRINPRPRCPTRIAGGDPQSNDAFLTPTRTRSIYPFDFSTAFAALNSGPFTRPPRLPIVADHVCGIAPILRQGKKRW